MSSEFDQFEQLVREQVTRKLSQAPVPQQPWHAVRHSVERRRRLRRLREALVVAVLVGLLAPRLGAQLLTATTSEPTATPGLEATPTSPPVPSSPTTVFNSYPFWEEPTATPEGFQPTRSTITPSLPPPPSAVPPTPTASAFQRHSSPPPGLEEVIEVEYVALGLMGCQALPEGNGLRLATYEPEYEIGEGFSICFAGVTPGLAVQLRVQDPLGRSVYYTLDDSEPSFVWIATPGDQLGVYEVTATQGDQQFTTTVRIKAATRPRLLVTFSGGRKSLRGRVGSPGDSLWIILAGFEPGQRVPLHLYRPGGDGIRESNWQYQSPLAIVEMDATGQAVYELATQADDPPGAYAIRTEPPTEVDAIWLSETFLLR